MFLLDQSSAYTRGLLRAMLCVRVWCTQTLNGVSHQWQRSWTPSVRPRQQWYWWGQGWPACVAHTWSVILRQVHCLLSWCVCPIPVSLRLRTGSGECSFTTTFCLFLSWALKHHFWLEFDKSSWYQVVFNCADKAFNWELHSLLEILHCHFAMRT
jgi:hypothetical protein